MDTSSISTFSEKEKLKYMNINNKNVLNRLEQFVELLDKIELTINEKVNVHLFELNEIQLEIKNCNNIFRTICTNLIVNQI